MPQQRISVFGEIGYAVTAGSVKSQLDALAAGSPVLVEINSDGGSVQEAIAIYNTLRTWPGGVDVEIVGWALSAATLIAMAGRTIRAHETALLMVHAPWVSASGNADQLREHAELLDQVATTMRTAYARTRQPAKIIDGWLDGQDHWMTADEALAAGLVDEVIKDPAQAAAPVGVRGCRFRIPSTVQQRINAMPQPNGSQQPGAGGAGDHAARAEGARIEAQRRTDIRAVFQHAREFDGKAELQRACEDDVQCTLEAAKDKVLAALGRGVAPAAGHYTPREPGEPRLADFRAAAVDVLLARGGIRVAEPHPAARDLQRLSVVGMAERILSMAGRSTRDLSRPQIIQAALSTSDFPLLLANVSGKSLRAGYGEAPATFAGWTGEREVVDFKTQSLVAISEAPALRKVMEGGEYHFGAFDESASTFTVETWGRIISITRQALINDDLSAFTSLPRAMGAAARRVEADQVYTKLTSNPTLADSVALFHADHGNLSAAAVPSLASLGAARAAMRKQKGISGLEYIDPQPRYLIVPVALETSCEQLLASLVDPSKSNDTPNVEWIRGLTLVSDPRLDAVSATQWYLAASPMQIEGIVRGYIQGEDRPFLDENAEFTRDVVAYKVRLDVCAGVVDYRALHRNG
jgi:ATP-dependent protease ClpP protease subunit